MQKTTIVNIRYSKYDVYIGRAGKGQSGDFGNPYNGPNRNKNIEDFRIYFLKRIKEDPEFKRKVLKLKGKILGCFCKEKACHGDIIADYLNNLETDALKLGVVGSRTFTDYDYMKNILDYFEIKCIISGGAKGADSLAKRYAIENNIDYKEFPAEWDKYGKSAGYKRNEQIVEAADEIMAFWDGKSKGTKHSLDIAKRINKPVHIYTFEPKILDDDIANWG